jgi:5'-deoxynucleotidase YfbR-like HD superfamily hydrolase
MSGQMVNERSTVDQWRIQGIKLFKKKYYDAAAQCFVNSADEELVLRCKAYKEADLGTAKISEADSCTWKAQVTKQITKIEKKKLIKDAKKYRAVGKKHFENAGFLFEKIKMLKHAASCFYTAKNYVKSGEIFQSLEYFG